VDFVVVGFALGALVLLMGLAVRDLAPRLSRWPDAVGSDQHDDPPAEPRHFVLAKDAPALWGRACRSLAHVMMIGGGAIVAATGIGIVGQLNDDNGARLVLAAALLAFGAIALRAGQIGNNIYGADRRARTLSRAIAVANAAVDGDLFTPGTETDMPVAAVNEEASDAVSANGAEPHSTPSSGASPPLPDLQTLLGERSVLSKRRRDEIVTLEQFLGLAPETSAAATVTAVANGVSSADEASSSPEMPVDAGAGDEPVATTSDEGEQDPAATAVVETTDEEGAVSVEEESSQPPPSDQTSETTPDVTAEAEERSEAAEENASAERSPAPTEPVAQSS
jgi:hypothetical protein